MGVARENDGAGVEQALRIEQVDDGGLIAHAGEGARFFVHGGDQAQIEVCFGGGHDVANFTRQEGIAAHEGNGR